VSAPSGFEPLIIDYKTGSTPSKKGSIILDGKPPQSFQIPFYVKLYEEKTAARAAQAFFVSINNAEYKRIIDNNKKDCERESFTETINALDGFIETYKNALDTLDFSNKEIITGRCSNCKYKTLCRTTFLCGD